MESGTRSVLSEVVDHFRLKDTNWLSQLRDPSEVDFLKFLRKQSLPPLSSAANARFHLHGYPVVAPRYPPLGSEIEKNNLINSFLFQGNRVALQRAMTVAISYRCSCDCPQCYTSQYRDASRRELSVDEFKVLFDKIVNQACVWHIDLTGGEPLEHPEFFDIIRQIPSDRATVMLATNGLLLDKAVVRRIRESNIMICKVSLDTPSKTKHDKGGLVEGAFDRIVEGIQLLVDNRIFTFVQTLVERNCSQSDELDQFITRCKELGVASIHFITPLMVGNLKKRKDLLLSYEDRKHLYLLQQRYQNDRFRISVFPDWEVEMRSSGRGCLAGRGRTYINPYGDVFPCNMYPKKCYGNILKKDLGAIIQEMQEDIPRHPEHCFSSDVTEEEIAKIRAELKTES